jgi:GTP-binding protein
LKLLDATFVTSAAAARDIPADARPQVALVGRSNVGKSSVINALTRRPLARTSAAPGKTRLANVYRVEARGGSPSGGVGGWSLYLVDLPGYGYARGGEASAAQFARLTAEYFGSAGPDAALLLVDSRHPGLERDLEAWAWLDSLGLPAGIVAMKVDKLGRTERTRALRELERSLNSPVLPVSAATGEGMELLWKLIARLVNPNPNPPGRP